MSLPDPNAIAADAFRHEELGLYALALEGYRKALDVAPDHFYAVTRSLLLQRHLKPEPPASIKILWQIDVAKCWETEWVRFLLSSCTDGEIIDGQHRVFEDGCIVVDRYLYRERPAYYFELLKRGCRFALFHTSDEHYWEDCTPYSFANFVFRNYWSRMHAQSRNVAIMPLGMVTGFRANAAKTATERTYLWCFIGNPGKRSRLEMLQALSSLERGFLYGTNAVNPITPTEDERTGPHPPMPIADYARALSDAIFALCPAGWENLDSYRVCEALEAGCIPIVERRPSFDYFRHLFDAHPMLVVDHWSDAPALIKSVAADPVALEVRRIACFDWWRNYKAGLRLRVRDAVLHSFSPVVASS